MTQPIRFGFYVFLAFFMGAAFGLFTWSRSLPREAAEIVQIVSELSGAHSIDADENDLLSVLRNRLQKNAWAGQGLSGVMVGESNQASFVYWEHARLGKSPKSSWLRWRDDFSVHLGPTILPVTIFWVMTWHAIAWAILFGSASAIVGIGFIGVWNWIRKALQFKSRNHTLEKTMLSTAHDLAPIAAGLRVVHSVMDTQPELSDLLSLSERRLSSVMATLRTDDEESAKFPLEAIDLFLQRAIAGFPEDLRKVVVYRNRASNNQNLESTHFGAITRVLDNLLRNARDEVFGGRSRSMTIELGEDGLHGKRGGYIRCISENSSFAEKLLKGYRSGFVASSKEHGEGIGLHSSYLLMTKMGGDLLLFNSHAGSVAEMRFPIFVVSPGEIAHSI